MIFKGNYLNKRSLSRIAPPFIFRYLAAGNSSTNEKIGSPKKLVAQAPIKGGISI